MNVSLQKLLIALLFLMGVPLLAGAQTEELETYQNNPVTYSFYSYYAPTILTNPSKGQVSIVQASPYFYDLTYQPVSNYVGEDLVKIAVWNTRSSWEIRRVKINVLPSRVQAFDDYTHTSKDATVRVDVLGNDFSSSGTLSLNNILLENSGQAAIDPVTGQLIFTPANGFTGTAYVEYTTCDEYNSCDQGTVIISVMGEKVNPVDTLRIFTKKNTAQNIFLPSYFEVASEPENGALDLSGSTPQYIPDENFTGLDYVAFSNGNMRKVVEISVLDFQKNTIAFDDEFYTTTYQSMEFNVLENDFYGSGSGCFQLLEKPLFGRVEVRQFPKGLMTYYPAQGFEGIDQFTYMVYPPDCSGEPEIATVYVYVSDFKPSSAKFKMFTPKHTPLIIGYNIPIPNFQFIVADQGELGEATFLQGGVDTVIYGQRIYADNVILYVPNPNVQSGTDEFEVVYCVGESDEGGPCKEEKSVKVEIEILDIGTGHKPLCFEDCIWAGDTNFDGVVNMEDLLPLGVFMGEIGKPREERDFNYWYGQYGENWGEVLKTAVDVKHIDTNGDSIITSADTSAISLFYGYTHAITPTRIPNYEHQIELKGKIFAYPGDLVELDMILGSNGKPAIDVYGFTFPFEYNSDFFDPESVEVVLDNNSWLSYNSPVLFMSKNNGLGLVEAGFTRTNGISASGHGKIGKLRIVVAEDIEGFRPGDESIPVEFGGGVATVMNSAGQSFGVKIQPFTLNILFNKPKPQENPAAEGDLQEAIDPELLKVYPNPATSQLNIHLNGGQYFDHVRIFNMAGQLVFDSGSVNTRRMEILVGNLENGLYLMTVVTDKGVINKKVEILR